MVTLLRLASQDLCALFVSLARSWLALKLRIVGTIWVREQLNQSPTVQQS